MHVIYGVIFCIRKTIRCVAIYRTKELAEKAIDKFYIDTKFSNGTVMFVEKIDNPKKRLPLYKDIKHTIDDPIIPAIVISFYTSYTEDDNYVDLFYRNAEEAYNSDPVLKQLYINKSARTVMQYHPFSKGMFEHIYKACENQKKELIEALGNEAHCNMRNFYFRNQIRPGGQGPLDKYCLVLSKETRWSRAFNPLFFKDETAAIQTVKNLMTEECKACDQTLFMSLRFSKFMFCRIKEAPPPFYGVREAAVDAILCWQICVRIGPDFGTLMYTDMTTRMCMDEAEALRTLLLFYFTDLDEDALVTVRWVVVPTKTKGKIDLFDEDCGSYVSKAQLADFICDKRFEKK